MSNFFYQRKLIISINDKLKLITRIRCFPQGSPISTVLFILYDSPQHNDAQVNISQFADDIDKNLSQILPWCDRWRIKLNPGRAQLINFSQRKVIKDTSIMKYDQPPKVTQSVIFLGTHIDNIKLHLEYIERASLIRRMRITRLNLILATLLIRLYNF